MDEVDKCWNVRATQIVRTAMIDERITFKKLAARLKEVGMDIDYRVLSNKINRGTFTFAFFLQIAGQLGIKEIKLDLGSMFSRLRKASLPQAVIKMVTTRLRVCRTFAAWLRERDFAAIDGLPAANMIKIIG